MAYVIDQKNCSCCHRCRMECPADAIRFKHAKYWIDPEKCIECGSCQTVCHNGAIAGPGPADTAAPHELTRLTCDVCVVGGGGAGMVAAAKAADLGADVIVLEKNHEIGGSAWYATGFVTHYSKLHAAAGLPDRRDALFQEFMERTQGQVDGALVKRLFQANAEWIDWLVDRYQLAEEYELLQDSGMFGPGFLRQKVHCSWNDRRIDGMIGPGGGGWFITSKMQKILQEKGARILCGTAAQRLICREDGQVTGVLAQDAGGPVEIRCAAVVIAAGAFTRNKAIMDKMQPLFYDDEGKEPVHIFTCSTCTGDGISMCEAIGADIDYVHRRVNMFGPMRHPYPGVTLNIGNGPMFRTDGVRYEKGFDNQEVSDLAFAPHRFVWKITNEANARAAIEAKIAQGPDLHGIDLGHFLRHWKAVLAEEAEDHSVVIADTLEELAEKLGFDPERFVSDIAQYHRSLSETPPVPPAPSPDGPGDGEMDLSFLMGPPPRPMEAGPYYAIKMKLFHENSVGGMVIDENTRVLRDGAPIPGLYAAGDNTRGIMLPGNIGVRYIERVFSALTVAFNTGYIAGVEAAAFAQGV